MNILFRAIITGFGLRMGSEIARGIATKLKERSSDDEQEAELARRFAQACGKFDASCEQLREEQQQIDRLKPFCALVFPPS